MAWWLGADEQGMAGFNPFQGMGVGNLNDPNAVSRVDPALLQQLTT